MRNWNVSKNLMHFTDKKHFKELLFALKLHPCYYNREFRARKLYFGSLISAPQSDSRFDKTLNIVGFSYFSIKNSIGSAHISNSFSVLSVSKSYNFSYDYFNLSRSLDKSSIWTFVKSNFFVNTSYHHEKTEQLRNFAILSYRHKLVEHLVAPRNRQDEVLGDRLNNFFVKYSVCVSAPRFLKPFSRISLFGDLFLVPSVSFFKIQTLFINNADNLILSDKKGDIRPLALYNNTFSSLSARHNTFCAELVLQACYFSRANLSMYFTKTNSFKNFFLTGRDFTKYLFSIKKNLPLKKPSALSRYNLINFVSKNAISRGDKRSSRIITHKWIKDHYEILYNDFLKMSSTTAKLISSSSRAFSKNKTLFSNKKYLSAIPIFKHLDGKGPINSVLNYYFKGLAKIHNSYLLESFFIRDTQYKQNRYVPYRRSRLSKYYKGLWSLPDLKNMKTRRK